MASANPRRVYLIAANHGQLLEKLRLAAGTPQVARFAKAIEERLFRKPSGDHDLRFELRDLSRGRAMLLVPKIIDEVTGHPGWNECADCPVRAAGHVCPIWENRARLIGTGDKNWLRMRLEALIEICSQNDVHLPCASCCCL